MTAAEIRTSTAWGIAMLAAAVAIAFGVYLARDAILLIYVSALLAIGFSPVVRVIERQPALHLGARRLPRWFAILVVYLAIMGVFTIAGFLIIPPLVEQARELWTRLPELLDTVQTFLIEHGLMDHRVTLQEAVRNTPASPGKAVGTVATAVSRIFTGILAFITLLILTFYLLVDGKQIFGGFARLFPRDRRRRVADASNEIALKVSAWLTGQLILAGTIGGSAALGLYLLGVPYFFVLGLFAAIGEMVPVVGPILSAGPAILAGLSVSPRTALFVAIFWIVQQQIENNLLVPKIMERQLGVSPVVVISALLIGGSLLGITGAILAVPTAAILQVLLQEVLDERDAAAP